MRQAKHQSGTVILGALAAGVFLLGLAAFLFVMATGPTSEEGTGLFAKAPPQSTMDPSLPAMPTRDFAVNPLALSEKAKFAELLPASLGMLEGGWQLRPFYFEDVWALRFDLEPCITVQTSHERCTFPGKNDEAGLWVYARGEERIAVAIQYHRSRVQLPHGEVDRAPHLGSSHSDIFYRAVPDRSWRSHGTRHGFEMSRYPVLESLEEPKSVLHRFHTEIKKDGEVNIFIAANTDSDTALSVLGVLDRKLIRALVAEPVMSDQDAVASIAQREVAFDVLSDADLRLKVAEMSPGKRNGYVKGIMKDALTKGRRPDDYAITYLALGDLGYVDTLDFLTGRMSQTHPGYKVLRQEARRSLPVGTCLQTPHDIYCGKKAEYLRIVHEIRRRNHASAELPTD